MENKLTFFKQIYFSIQKRDLHHRLMISYFLTQTSHMNSKEMS